jgi:hypothetical protein
MKFQGRAFLRALTPATLRTPQRRYTMTRPYQNSWQSKPRNHYYGTSKDNNWENKQQRADDQIAPSGVSRTIEDLQRWALMTANMPQQPTIGSKARANEDEMRECIQRRYEDPSQQRTEPYQAESARASENDHVVIDLTEDAFPALPTKRRHSPPLEENTESYVRSIKQRRLRSPSPMQSAYAATRAWAYQTEARNEKKMEEEHDYAESSEWSFPSSQGGEDERR